MSIALDTNVLVRMLVHDPSASTECAAAKRLVDQAVLEADPLLVTLCTLLETEVVLRSRYKVERSAFAAGVSAMLESPGLEFEHAPTVEEALYLFNHHSKPDFADCLQIARATHLGRNRFITFDAGVALLPRGELLV